MASPSKRQRVIAPEAEEPWVADPESHVCALDVVRLAIISDAAQLEDDDASQATTQDSHWRAGVNRQAQPQAQQHQLPAHCFAGSRS